MLSAFLLYLLMSWVVVVVRVGTAVAAATGNSTTLPNKMMAPL